MKMNKKNLLIPLLAIAGFMPVQAKDMPLPEGPYKPTWESLMKYDCPEWFRDAKFGIWAHWGPQCVEESGDWNARSIYLEGSKQYKEHIKNYGHPSEYGFKDVLPDFKAENWDPDSLLRFYKSVGAKYFMALGNHHDNYDLWDSQYQPWNSKNIGPHRDVLGEWAAASKKVGLPFGVSLHADHAWSWYEPSRRYDRGGEKMGVKYDGWLTKEDGKGKWWEGLDPQDLYAQNHPLSEGTWADGMIHRQWAWQNGVCEPSPEFRTNFLNRTLDVIDRYNPDMLYFDVTVAPFYNVDDTGQKIAASLYNHSLRQNKGRQRGVMMGKILPDSLKKALTWDVERGAPNELIPLPWQTCTCIGGWHYDRDTYEKNWYKTAAQVARMLFDVVSKNGNLLLSVPLRADGTFDEKEYAILLELRDWMKTNGEAIYSTRPWTIFGEGPIADSDISINAQGFNEGSYMNPSSEEIRFTQTPKYLYAAALKWPDADRPQTITIKSLAKGSDLFHKNIGKVELLGHGKVPFRRTADGLVIELPASHKDNIAPVFRIKK